MKSLKLIFFVLILFHLMPNMANAQRKMEVLDRGLVAVKVDNGVFLSWRIMGYEWEGVMYNVYRDGTKLNAEPLEVSNYSDTEGTESSTYTVNAIVDGIEQAQCDAVETWAKQYNEIKLKTRNTTYYEINDATVADLDGDGEYEIIVKRLNYGYYYGNDSTSYFEAYKQDGTLMWEINVGPNIYSSSGVEINIAAFDFNEDGKAEVFMRTSDGTVFGDGTNVGDRDNDGVIDYRPIKSAEANREYPTRGPEYLSLIDGETGAELDWVNFIPRISADWWGDGYGHRANKFFFGAPYLDGKHPSLFIGRGIYTKTIMRTYDITDDMKLEQRWEFRAESGSFYGQGNHNYTIADVDEDGRDEIVWGSMTVDDNGKGLYSTQMGHGDALHVGDFDPYRKGTEIWKCLENSPMYGTILYDGATGEILIHDKLDRDCGRCMAANISNTYPGAELWGSTSTFSATTLDKISAGGSVNFRIFWDGDLLDELLDKQDIYDSPGVIDKPGKGRLLTANGTLSCNWTKGTPALQADLFGDWREEVIWRNNSNTAIRIYTTVTPTVNRLYTLMHDHQYRQAICWQMCGYNQPPHVSFFVGESENLRVPPPPTISNEKLVYTGSGDWSATSANFNLDGTDVTYEDGKEVLFDVSSGNEVSLNLTSTVQPKTVTVNSPGNYSIDGSAGKLSGNMKLIKQGLGTLTLTGDHDYAGETKVWNGSLVLDGTLENSQVNLHLFGELYAKGEIKKGLLMKNSALLAIGADTESAKLTISNGVTMQPNSIIEFDLYAADSDQNDTLVINGDFTFANNSVFRIVPHLAEGEEKLSSGNYLLATVSGTVNGALENIVVEGISGTASKIVQEGDKIYLSVKTVRAASSIVWNGTSALSTWDLAVSESFLNGGTEDIFVDQDIVLFNDAATIKTVEIATEVTPSAIFVDAADNYILRGDGNIAGNATFTKNGSGKVIVYNNNDFTGKVTINEGEVIVRSLASSVESGALGAPSTSAANFEINGGQLTILNEGSAKRAITIGENGGRLSNSAKLEWNGFFVGGQLVKAGTGQLILDQRNTVSKFVVGSGRLTLLNDNATPGNLVSLRNGTTLDCSNNIYSSNTMTWSIEVPEGNSTTINLDGRGYYTGKLTGGGNIVMNVPFVRTDINGDWSGFSGTLNLYSTCTLYDEGNIRFNNSRGLPQAHVIVNPSLYISNESGSTLTFGALSGTGRLASNETYVIGAKNIDTEFKGRITNGSLKKQGTGTFTLSNANTYSGSTIVEAGVLNVTNGIGSATGTGSVTVGGYGTLAGTGIISGLVTVNAGGTLAPGTRSFVTKLNLNGNLKMLAGSIYKVNVNPLFGYANSTTVGGSVIMAGNLDITNTSTLDFKVGDEFKIFDASSFAGTFESITPAKPGIGLRWDLSELDTRGVIKVDISDAAEEVAEPTVAYYPNPATDLLYINTKNLRGQSADLSIVDYTGRKWFGKSIGSSQLELNVADLPKGVYFIVIESETLTYKARFIKQ